MPAVLDNPFEVPNSPHRREPRPMTTLADLLRQEMDRRAIGTTMELGKEIGVGQGTAWRLLNKGSVPREDTLGKIAKFLRMSITDVRKAADRAVGEPTHFALPREFDQLNKAERELLLRMGWQLLAAHGVRVTRRS